MSWIVEGFEERISPIAVFSAEAHYLADVFLAVRDAASLDCNFICVIRKGKRHSNLTDPKPPIPHGVCVESEPDPDPKPAEGWIVVTLNGETWSATSNGKVIGPFHTREEAVNATHSAAPTTKGADDE